jgi:adenylylsulfate kinase
MYRKILIMGLPGAGKTALARALTSLLSAVHFNADEIRQHINKDLGFSEQDRVEQARRMGWLCDQVVKAGNYAIADFVCPTAKARAAFLEGGDAFIVWVDRIERSRFEDTNKLFVPPELADIRVTAEGTVEYWREQIAWRVRPIFDSKKPTALFIGRYQPFHDGHKALIVKGLQRVGQACIAVRDTAGTNANNPWPFVAVRARIEHALRSYEGQFDIVQLPNISHVLYGRDVGYVVERMELDSATEAISGTEQRRRMATPSLDNVRDGAGDGDRAPPSSPIVVEPLESRIS